MTQLMHAGKSWSGNERNCAYLNTGDGSFVDVSAAAGLDFIDDGRSMAVTDWDGDGDLDIWLKNRTGPQLRLLRNDTSKGNSSVAFKLVGKTCNRDAIGARITLKSGSADQIKVLNAGDGYLAQSSKWVHFGIPAGTTGLTATIQWPDGKSQGPIELESGARYEVVQNESPRKLAARPRLQLTESPADDGTRKHNARIVLRQPLAAPPSLRAIHDASHAGPTVVVLWAHWCAPCRQELQTLASESERLQAASIRVVALNVDRAKDRDKAIAFINGVTDSKGSKAGVAPIYADDAAVATISAIVRHMTDQDSDALVLPMSFLISANGDLQVLYVGAVDSDLLMEDSQRFGRDTAKAFRRAAFPGRWFFRIQRNLADLAADLRRVGNDDDAEFYDALSR